MLRTLHLLLWLLAAAALEVRVPAEANGKTAKMLCGGWSGIAVGKATFGASCFSDDRHDGCAPSVCKANCGGCNPVSCPAVNGAAAGKCAQTDVTTPVSSACDGRGECVFPVCIVGVATPGSPAGDPAAQGGAVCTTPPTKWPLGDPAYGCSKEFVVEYSCTAWGWDFIFVVVVGGGGYIAVMTWHNKKTKGLAGKAALPHRAEAEAVLGLVRDGLQFARSGRRVHHNSTSGGRAPLAVPQQLTETRKKGTRKEKKKTKQQRSDSSVDASRTNAAHNDRSPDRSGQDESGNSTATIEAAGSSTAGAKAAGTAAGGGGRCKLAPGTCFFVPLRQKCSLHVGRVLRVSCC